MGEIDVDDHKKLLAALGDREVQKGLPIYLDLDSKGGNFEEGLKIAQIALDKRLSIRLGKNADCLSACAIIFMAGSRFTTVGSTLERRMHPTAKLGFHAPTLDVGGGTSSVEEMNEAYDEAVEGIGSKLLAIARFRGRIWNNPLIRSDLVNEMMLRRGTNFYFIDTVRKAVMNEIELDDAGGPSINDDAVKDACANFLALHSSSQLADDTWYGPIKKTHDSELVTYEVPLNRGQCIAAVPVDGDTGGPLGFGSVSISEVNGEKGTYYLAEAWGFWPGAKRLESLPPRPPPKPAPPARTAALPEPEPQAAPPPFVPSLGYSWNYRTRRAGEKRALNACTGSCRIAVWFHHTCGAIAVGERGGWGTGWHGNKNEARRKAIAFCTKVDTGCTIKNTICSPGGYGAIAVQNPP